MGRTAMLNLVVNGARRPSMVSDAHLFANSEKIVDVRGRFSPLFLLGEETSAVKFRVQPPCQNANKLVRCLTIYDTIDNS